MCLPKILHSLQLMVFCLITISLFFTHIQLQKNGKTYTVPSTVKQITDGAFAQTGGQNAHEGMTSKGEKRE